MFHPEKSGERDNLTGTLPKTFRQGKGIFFRAFFSGHFFQGNGKRSKLGLSRMSDLIRIPPSFLICIPGRFRWRCTQSVRTARIACGKTGFPNAGSGKFQP
ncbi:MAG TPA: hypothetical protein DEB39_01520, partial [Planctomycetaceae bacterium]|nr:hypothetical protein [Planctomycetaceae bacterium]